jgi:hypothetical protein
MKEQSQGLRLVPDTHICVEQEWVPYIYTDELLTEPITLKELKDAFDRIQAEYAGFRCPKCGDVFVDLWKEQKAERQGRIL